MSLPRIAFILLAVAAAACAGKMPQGRTTRYADLLSLFQEWRTFQRPPVVEGVPDYSVTAMAAQHAQLADFQARLAAIEPTQWPVARQVDYRIVQAEMNGLDFDHRVLKPWSRNPAFYVTVFPNQSDQPAREGPFAYGGIELWSYRFPLSPEDAERVRTGLRIIPRLLGKARENLTGDARGLWVMGIESLKEQSADLAALLPRVAGTTPDLTADIQLAKTATDSLVGWLESQTTSKGAASGVGIEAYDWYLRNVQLLPYTWQDLVALFERELGRSRAFLKLEEARNQGLPPLEPIANAEEHARRFNQAVTDYMAFLRDRDLLTIHPYLEPALRARIGTFRSGERDFFAEVDYRDPKVMRTHGFHWFDLARMAQDPGTNPIRRDPLLYNIFNTRTEGLATGWEEMMLMAGMFDGQPRSRELIYVLVAQRAARALGELMMHANRFTIEQAVQFATANTPRGWLRSTMGTVWGEQHLYLQQPGYGISYLIGKMEIEKLVARRADQLGERFALRPFMDELLGVGLIPISLVKWELTGEK